MKDKWNSWKTTISCASVTGAWVKALDVHTNLLPKPIVDG